MGEAQSTAVVEYGLAPGRAILVGPSTISLLIQPELESPGAEVWCRLSRGDIYLEQTYSAEDWNSGEVVLSIPPTAGVPSDYLVCSAQASSGFEITWNLTPADIPATQVSLTEGAEYLTSYTDRQRYQYFSQSPGTIGIGDTVEIVGAPGTWPAIDGEPAPVFDLLLAVQGPRAAHQAVTEYSVSEDGSTLTMQVPDTLPPRFWGSRTYLGATATTTFAESPTSPVRTETTIFESFVQSEADRTSRTRLTLVPPVTVSSRPARAVVRLSSPGLTDVYGKLTLLIDGSEREFIFVEPEDHSRVIVTLPALPKGPHEITMIFEGDPRGVAGSSATATLRVLR